jgi:Flp pilus assembly protein TadG
MRVVTRIKFVRTNYHRNGNSEGFILPMAGLLIVACIAVYGLAIDLTRVYITKNRLQRAVDAGAVSGSRLIGTGSNAMTLDIARDFALQTIRLTGHETENLNVESRWQDGEKQTEVFVSASVTIPNIFLRFIPSFPKVSTVSADSVATTKMTIICLLVDVSNSTKDISSSNGRSKNEDIKASVKEFLNLFQEENDYIGIVTFATDIITTLPMTTQFREYLDDVDTMNYQPPDTGSTNTEFGLKKCREELFSLPAEILETANKSVVIITDGAPTVSCDNENEYQENECEITKSSGEKIPYDRAIRIADDIRSADNLGIAVSAVVVGEFTGNKSMDAEELERVDAYQGLWNSYLIDPNGSSAEDKITPVKTNFLRRLVNVPPLNGVEPVNYFEGGETFETQNFNDYNAANPGVRQGLFYYTDDTSELSDIIRQIGLSMKGRLIK